MFVIIFEKGKPVIGVIHEPWFSQKDGTFGDTIWDVVGLNKCQFQHTSILRPVMTANPSADLLQLTKELGISDIVQAGGTGHKMAKVFRGKGNAYFQGAGRTCRWDICAGEAIFRLISQCITFLFEVLEF